MSVKKKLSGFPATLLGIVLGCVVGGLAVLKQVFADQFPKIGLIIIFVTPLAAFAFEQVISRAFPEAYWEHVAGNLLKAYRWVVNQGFRLYFIYVIRFVLPPGTPPISAAVLLTALKAKAGGEPEPSAIGSNYIQLGFRELPFLVTIKWDVENEPEEQRTIFTLTMQPETRDILMRRAQSDIDGIMTRLNRLQERLVTFFKTEPEKQAIVRAWLGDVQPPAIPIRPARKDTISDGEYQTFPGLLHVTGTDLSALGAVPRYVGTLEEPPDE